MVRSLPAERPEGTRALILEATQQVIDNRGIASATTKEIARAAGCAEGSIYRYFEDKHALFMELVKSRFSGFFELVDVLPERAGTSTVRRNLEEVASRSLQFYRGIVPIACGAVAEHGLLHQQRAHFRETRGGPIKIIGSLAEYLRREQRLGRVSEKLSARHTSQVFLGACFAHAYLAVMLGDDAVDPDERFAKEVVRSLTEGLRPAPEGTTVR